MSISFGSPGSLKVLQSLSKVVPIRGICTTSLLAKDGYKVARMARLKLATEAADAARAEREGRVVDPPFVKPYGHNDMMIRKGLFRPDHSYITGIKYMQSQAFKDNYGDKPVWVPYRRNTRLPMAMLRPLPIPNCCPKKIYITNWPCPICRDEYLVVDYRNIALTLHFTLMQTGEIIEQRSVHVCGRQYLLLQIALARAKEVGLIDFGTPFRNYNYKNYYDWWDKPEEEPVLAECKPIEANQEFRYKIHPTYNHDYWPRYDF